VSFTSTIPPTLLSLFTLIATCEADTIIDFESPLPGGLVPVSYIEDTPVTDQARITDQYGSLGVLMTNVALVDLGLGHAPSGTNGIAGISASGTVDYGSPVFFTFVDPLDNSVPSVIDHFAISTDRAGGSFNTTTLSAFDIMGNFLGLVSAVETGGSVTLELQGLGQIHMVEVSSTLMIHDNGGIGLDNLRFGAGDSAPVPESSTYVFVSLGLVCLSWLRNHGKRRYA